MFVSLGTDCGSIFISSFSFLGLGLVLVLEGTLAPPTTMRSKARMRASNNASLFVFSCSRNNDEKFSLFSITVCNCDLHSLRSRLTRFISERRRLFSATTAMILVSKLQTRKAVSQVPLLLEQQEEESSTLSNVVLVVVVVMVVFPLQSQFASLIGT